ncbi:hypothetical protein [Tritonibacter scottomollicae]|nr:hypothetical protein [Tritonibacter scottomollicae]
MAYAAQLHVLGVLAGVIDGPTEEYRAAVAEAAGSYFSNLMERSQREHWWENSSPLDGAATVLGWYYEGLGIATQQIPVEAVQEIGRSWENTGEDLQSTDPDKLIFNLGADALSSLWDACEARWEEFWDDFDREGLLSAMARLKADADFLAAELAIDIALAVATGGVATGVKIVAKRLAGKVSRVVIRAANQAGRAVPDSAVLHRIDLPDTEIDDRIVRQVLDEDNLRTGSSRGDLSSRAEVDNPGAEKPAGGMATRLTSKQVGDLAEDQARRDLVARGYTDQRVIQNPQGNGVDIIARNPETGEVVFGEVKANSARLSPDQSYRGGPDYVKNRLNRVMKRQGEWASATTQQRKDAASAIRWLRDDPAFKEIKYDVDPEIGATTNYRERTWDYNPGERPKRITWRNAEGAPVTASGKPKKPPARGPPDDR